MKKMFLILTCMMNSKNQTPAVIPSATLYETWTNLKLLIK
jgi:hypothetical protein